MSIRFARKVALVERWAPVFARASAVVVWRPLGMHGVKETELRRTLDLGGEGRYLVLKNRVAARIFQGTRLEPLVPLLRGETSFFLAFGDPQAALRRLFSYLETGFPRAADLGFEPDRRRLEYVYPSGQKAYRRGRYLPPKLDIKGGIVEGAIASPEEIRSIAALPSRDELRSQLLATLGAPMASLLATLEAPSRAWLGLLSARGQGALPCGT